jgi:NAD(P)H-dependent FMN reductase
MPNIAIIVTSTRKGRVGHHVGAWIKKTLAAVLTDSDDVKLTLVDVQDFNLPIFDEPVIPAMIPAHAQWTTAHGKAWSDEIQKYDAYVFISNEYNFGPSSATKNAIDFLYHAWIGKPILIVTYGIMGGTFSSDQLANTFKMMHLRPVETRPQLAYKGGPHGEELRKAFGGELAETTIQLWEDEKKNDVLKGWEELVKAVGEKPEVHEHKEGEKEKAADAQGVEEVKAEL